MARTFDYAEAFSRNIGWVTETEQYQLRGKRVAIAGMGGVGGAHLLTLARLGIGAFHIADLDTFELANFNRQAGAMLSSLAQPKVEVLARMARDINPELEIQLFPQGVSAGNVDAFLSDVDLFVDGLDFFVPEMRSLVFGRCDALGIPAITAGPIGMGAPYLIFLPGQMSFEKYFQLAGLPVERQYVNFLLGLTPKAWHRTYLVDPNRLDLANRRGPSTPMACQLCAGIVGIEALKILLHRQPVYAAPRYHLFDGYRGGYVRGQLRWGNRGPLQTLKRRLAYRAVDQRLAREAAQSPREPEFVPRTDLERILDLGRWAPSGDNAQPWRFEVRGEEEVVIHAHSHGGEDVYEYNDAQPTQLSIGFLLESLRLAATRFSRRMVWTHTRVSANEHRLIVQLLRDSQVEADPLVDFLRLRSVDRRRYQTTPLTERQKELLSACLNDELQIFWQETRAERWRMAKLTALASDIRLRIPEAFTVHQRIMDWRPGDSSTGIPAAAIGLDPLALKIMGWTLQEWSRADFFNRFLSGTLLPRVELDLLPGLSCAAHFVIVRRTSKPKTGTEAEFLLRTGECLQRFWLTATRLGLVMQPAVAPLCFAYYGQHDIPFTKDAVARRKAGLLAARLAEIIPGEDAESILFMGRLGFPAFTGIAPRSVRRPLSELLRVSTDGFFGSSSSS